LQKRGESEVTAETVQLIVGSAASVALQENPSTGYRWQIDEVSSTNLGLLRIADGQTSLGSTGTPLIGAPIRRLWRVEGLAVGTASVVFIQLRPWERNVAPISRHTLTVNVRAR
jgi:inhibitor of cysteine peptidase